jgi:hypothetical protein
MSNCLVDVGTKHDVRRSSTVYANRKIANAGNFSITQEEVPRSKTNRKYVKGKTIDSSIKNRKKDQEINFKNYQHQIVKKLENIQ